MDFEGSLIVVTCDLGLVHFETVLILVDAYCPYVSFVLCRSIETELSDLCLKKRRFYDEMFFCDWGISTDV